MTKPGTRPARPIFGYALAFIFVLGLMGGIAAVIQNGGHVPVDAATAGSSRR